MKEVMLELGKLTLATLLVLVAIFAFIGCVALMVKGITFLPPYIGGFGTFLIYVSLFVFIFVGIYEFNKRQK